MESNINKNRFKTIIILIVLLVLIGIILYVGQKVSGSKSTLIENNSATSVASGTGNSSGQSLIDVSSLFSSRDKEQTVDLKGAVTYTLEDNKNIEITKAGTYVIKGNASNSTIQVEVGDEDKVQIVLDGVTIENENLPCIYLVNADKLFITTAENSENKLTVSSEFTTYNGKNVDAVISAKDDIVINGNGKLIINSSDNGISCNNDIKITGGVLDITSTADAIEAKQSIAIADGNITINSEKDGLHAEDNDDDTTGFIYIGSGNININAAANAIHATTIAQVDNGEITIKAWEGIEATCVQINDGTLDIESNDDCINAGAKADSSLYYPTIEINGGILTLKVAEGDTDAIDSNGNLYVNGGEINITAQNAFDYDGECEQTGGRILSNGDVLYLTRD
jgi:F0F1-type ATP synthase epsilon subunit